MSKRHFAKRTGSVQNLEELSSKKPRSHTPARLQTFPDADQLPTTSRQSTSNKGSSDKVPTADPSLQGEPYKIRCAKLSSVPEHAYEENGVPRIAVGQEVGEQFDTLKFLGFGTYATIWLVKNKVDGNYEALKITKSDPDYQRNAKRESQKNNYSSSIAVRSAGTKFNEVLNQCDLKFHPNVLKNMIKQLLKAVEYVHLKGIIHMDIKPANIMFAICEEDVRNVATSLDDSHNIYHLDLAHANSKFTLKLGDFGIAFKTGVHNERQIAPTCTYCAPESILTTEVNFPIDMWSVGCVIYKIVTRRSLISCARDDGHYHDHLIKMAEILGSIPRAPFNNFVRPECTHYFGADDHILYGGNPDTHKIFVDAATRHDYLNATEAECFSKFVSQFFKLDPKKRVTAKKALIDDFLLLVGDKSVKIETAEHPGLSSVDLSDASTSQPCSSASGN
uniref:Protein kinase domain-containing protein n=1 Tax=Caenorhabditis tropicalis TaxID=1561998 RepID=A0A1I7U1V1_9PELO